MAQSSSGKQSRSSQAVQEVALDRLSACLRLDSPVSNVKLVSAERARAFASLGVVSVRDLLLFYPYRYLDMAQVRTIQTARIGEQCTLIAKVYEIKAHKKNPRFSLTEVTLVDETGTLIMSCFNQSWLSKQVSKNDVLRVSGKVEFSYGFKRVTNPYWEKVEEGDIAQGLVMPIHPATSKLSRRVINRIVGNALEEVCGLYDVLPLSLKEKYRLCSRYQAFRMIHFPCSMDEVTQAKRRLLYEELLFLELHLLREKERRAKEFEAYSQPLNVQTKTALEEILPFELSSDQRQAIEEIGSGMADASLLNHLLLGDVGTGKTVVSLFALVTAAQAGNQAVMIAPTEVLVWQYAASLGPYLEQLGISWELLTGSTSEEARTALLARLRKGTLQVLFGTHALLEDDVAFARCSFVCIDEQQRFGVDQRERLIAKAPGADVLSMTATPIPRSYALTLYGDMTLSYLKQAPSKQKGRTTKVCHFSEEGIAYDALRACVERGEQAFVICPLIGMRELKKEEEAKEERIEYASIEWGIELDSFEDASKEVFTHAQMIKNRVVPHARVEVLHGKLSSKEKNEIMESFRDGLIDVLVSTTVVEVGVDVPSASVMIIEDADRFGLAQLHQLRGRVGRGEIPGEVFLISRSKSPQAIERLKAMEKTEDGFTLSEYDLLQRKEGDIFGVRQHGRPSLRLVNVIRDKAVIEAARNDAEQVLSGKICSEEERHILLRELDLVTAANRN